MKKILLLTLFLELSFSQKLALVIGNSNYTKGYLSNPINDAKLIAKTLEDVGFRVMIRTNIKSKSDMERVINSFASKVSSSDTVAVYYSGHGVQYNGKDYLMPTKANAIKKGQLPSVSVDVNFLLGGVSDAKLAIVMLDACRNNPYRSFIRGVPKGLGQASVSADGGMIISYATEANHVANDGDGENSPYALALKKYIKTSDPIETVFRKVRGEVSRLTNREQKPMTKMLFEGDFAFMSRYIPPVVVPVEPKPVPVPVPRPHTTKGIVKIGDLMYQNQPFTKYYSWEDAKGYCKDLTLGGYSDWRLPSRNELNKLMTGKSSESSKGYTQYIRKEFVENMPEFSWFWTSKTYEKDSSLAWNVVFIDGYDRWYLKTLQFSALCVR